MKLDETVNLICINDLDDFKDRFYFRVHSVSN